MALTGSSLWLYTQGLIDKDYSDFLSTSKANRFFESALYNVIEQKVAVNDSQKIYDELGYLYKTDFPIPSVSNNRILHSDILVTGFTISGGGALVTTGIPHNYTTGEFVTILDINGCTLSDTSYAVTVITPYTFTIVDGTAVGTYTGGGYTYGQNQLRDYLRLLAIKVQIQDISLADTYVTAATNATPIVVTLNNKTRLRDGSYIVISGILGNTAANGTFYVKQINNRKYALYTDADLRNGVTGNGTYVDSPSSTISTIYDSWCTPYLSDRKISAFGKPTVNYPTFEDTENAINLYPADKTVLSAILDYIAKPSVLIDVADNAINLELVYPNKFLYAVANEFANIFAMAVKDGDLYRTSENEIIQNP
jgi:hypothetical protein